MKRAQIFDVTMVLVVLGALISILLVMGTIGEKTSSWEGIGQRALELQSAYAKGDLFSAYAGTHARWAAGEAVLELGNSGGHIGAPCGTKSGIALWNNEGVPEQFCIPLAHHNFYALLKQKMELRVVREGKTIPYEFLLEGNVLRGIALKPVHVFIITPEERERVGNWVYRFEVTYGPAAVGTYAFRPDFSTPFPYDIGIYDALGNGARAIITECPALQDVMACVKQKLEGHGRVEVVKEGNILLVSITQDVKSAYFGNAAPVIRFGLYLPSPKTI